LSKNCDITFVSSSENDGWVIFYELIRRSQEIIQFFINFTVSVLIGGMKIVNNSYL